MNPTNSLRIVGWQCGPCGWQTFSVKDMHRFVNWREPDGSISLVCPQCGAEGQFIDAFKEANVTREEIIEECAEAVHDKWMATKRAQGVTSRPAEDGTEQIAPYATLPEHIKDLDRGSVEAVVDALVDKGLIEVA